MDSYFYRSRAPRAPRLATFGDRALLLRLRPLPLPALRRLIEAASADQREYERRTSGER